jgi:tetratricopeptide (TPR) repeat protein
MRAILLRIDCAPPVSGLLAIAPKSPALADAGQELLNVGAYTTAAPLYEEALAIRTKSLGAEHPSTVLSRDNLAMLYWPMKKIDRSISLLEESFSIRKRQLVHDHPELLGRQVTLGSYYCDAGRFAEGIALIDEVRRKSRNDPHPAWVSSALLTAYVQAGKSTEAAALVSERVLQARVELPADSPELAVRLADAGKTLIDAKAYQAAELLLRDSLAIGQGHLPETLDTHYARSLLGGALLGQKRYAEAEPLLLIALEGLRRSENLAGSQTDQLRVRDAQERLVHLYEGWGQPDKAAPWRRPLESSAGVRMATDSEGL